MRIDIYIKLFKRSIILGLILFNSNICTAQIDSLIKYVQDDEYVVSIKTEKEYFRYIGLNPYVDSVMILEWFHKSPHYFFKLLDSIASDDKLIELTTHESPIVQAYAAEVIANRDTLLLPLVIENMLDNYSRVKVLSGCVVLSRTTASQVYSGLRSRRHKTGLPTQSFIDKLDSIYLSHSNTPSLDIGLKLNDLRSKSLNPVIEKVVLERKDVYATDYLYKWYKGEYYDILNDTYLDILDSCTNEWFTPNVKDVITKLIELDDKETLIKLGSWLNNNREKWVGIKNIDNTLDRSYLIRDCIGWNSDRYPFDSVDVNFLLGDWVIISGLDNYSISTYYGDTIILKKSVTKKEIRKHHYQKIGFELEPNGLFSHYYESVFDNEVKMVGSPTFDSIITRISFRSTSWIWYKIIKEEDKLILIRE